VGAQEVLLLKLIRSLIDTVRAKLDGEKPWEFEAPKIQVDDKIDPRRAAEQAKQIKLGYSVEIVNKGEGVRYTEGLRYVEANLAWAGGAKVWLNTLREWTRPERRPLTVAEYTKALTRVCEYLSCDGTEVTLVDQATPVEVEDAVVEKVILPRVPLWRRLERDGKIVEERPALPAAP
jgi:hypothetical protein